MTTRLKLLRYKRTGYQAIISKPSSCPVVLHFSLPVDKEPWTLEAAHTQSPSSPPDGAPSVEEHRSENDTPVDQIVMLALKLTAIKRQCNYTFLK